MGGTEGWEEGEKELVMGLRNVRGEVGWVYSPAVTSCTFLEEVGHTPNSPSLG